MRTPRGLAVALAGLLLPAVLPLGCNPSMGPSGGGPDASHPAECLPLDAGLPEAAAWQGVDSGPAGEPLPQFADDYYQALCDSLARCRPFEHYLVAGCLEQLRATGTWSPPTECAPIESVGAILCESENVDVTDVAAHVAAVGTELSYDAQLAAACLAAPWTVCYFRNVILPSACESIFSPLVPDGGVCHFDLACLDGRCATDAGLCQGSCVPLSAPPPPYLPAPGSFCGYGVGCGADAGLACDGVYCRADAGLGTSCTPGHAFWQCGPGLYCADDGGSCQPQLAEGAVCLYNPANENVFVGVDLALRCQTGLVCQGEALLTDGGLRPGTCQPLATLGQACTALAPDEVEHRTGCMSGAVCSCGVCVPPPTAGACGDGLTPCLPGVSACDYFDAGVCLPVTSFEKCLNGQQCATGYCDSLFGTCVPTPGATCPG